MIEMFKDKKMRKSMVLSASVVSFLILEIYGLSNKCPWEWVTILAWVLFLLFVFVFLTIVLGFIFYSELYDED